MEEWRIIDSNPDYQVSNTGLVRSIKHNRVKVLRPALSCGYWQISTWSNGVQTHHNIHRLVAIAFIPNPDGKKEVDHINRVKTDNRVENLRWATRSENNINVSTRSEHRNIQLTRSSSYCVRIWRNNRLVFCKNFPTIEEAIAGRDEYLASL
jgi:hypothetical protein